MTNASSREKLFVRSKLRITRVDDDWLFFSSAHGQVGTAEGFAATFSRFFVGRHCHRRPGQEVLLNKLLNEMDGLREDADVFFILTTNRPDQLEPALASRPGRIDQAIEFPLPDEESRIKLVKLYSRGLQVPEQLMHLIVCRTKGVSPAFIKELMRRSAQFQFELGADAVLQPVAVNAAIEEMVFVGGALNLKLLGGSATELGAGPDG